MTEKNIKRGSTFPVKIEGADKAYGVVTGVTDRTVEGFWFAEDSGKSTCGPLGTTSKEEIEQVNGWMGIYLLAMKLAQAVGIVGKEEKAELVRRLRE